MAYDRKIFGVRNETLLRLEKLYQKAYFQDRHGKGKESYEKEVASREFMYLQELERVKQYVKNFKRGGNVLDIGCGRGEFLSLFGEKWNKYGIEISEHAATIARQNGITINEVPRDNFFDVIVFRGTIQHIPDPVVKIQECFYWLKKNGVLVFLATPNTHSIVYRLFKELPMIDERLNFLLPSDKVLRQVLSNFGFKNIVFSYPYWNTPYANPLRDLLFFALRLLGKKKKFPFPGNMLECYATK